MSVTQSSSAALPTQAQPVGMAVAAAEPTIHRAGSGGRAKSTVVKVFIWALLIGFSALFLYPFVWLLSASLKPRGQVFDNALIPETFVPENYLKVRDELPLLNWIGTSLVIALLAA